MQEHGVPISAKYGMTEQDLTRAVRYNTHASATEETDLVRAELSKQARSGHIALFSLLAIHHLPQLWLSPLVSIPWRDRKPRLIYDFSWCGLNKEVPHVAHN